MKTRIKVMSLIFAFAATLASCEKDDTQPSATNNNHTTSEIQQADKKSNGTNKSNEVDIELSNFIESVVYDFGDLSTMNATNALELTESTLYWKFSNYDAIPGETQMFDLNYDVSLTYMNGEWLISTTSILALNEAISLDLNNIGAGASSNEGSTGAKYWFEMDVIVPDNPADYSPTYNVKVKATLGFKSSGNCNQMVAWKGYINGKCSSPSNKYVVSVVTSKLNNPNCSFSNVEYCGGTIGSGHTTVYNKIPKGIKGRYNKNRQVSGLSFLWWDPYWMMGCISANTLNNHYINSGASNRESIPRYGDLNRSFPGKPAKKIKSYRVHKSYSSSNYKHLVDVIYYDKCALVEVVIPIGPPNKPEPQW